MNTNQTANIQNAYLHLWWHLRPDGQSGLFRARLYENAWIWACPLNKGGLTNYLGAVSNLAGSAIKKLAIPSTYHFS